MAVVALRQSMVHVATVQGSAVAGLTDAQREAALRMEALLMPAIEQVRSGVSIRRAARWIAQTRARQLDCSAVTVARHISAYLERGLPGLAPQYKGRVRKTGGWELRAQQYYILPSQPCFATITKWLIEDDGFDPADCTVGRVQRYIESLPADESTHHPQRIGPKYRRLNHTPAVLRDRTTVPVGMIYEGDGHQLHWYVRHPATGRHFKPELLVWMDIRSRYIVGWWMGYVESSQLVLYALCDALVRHDHVMALLHVDRGSGFKNRAMCDSVAGFAPRVGAEYMLARPQNARAKGDIEGWFRWFEERAGKKQPSYAGREVPQEYLSKLEKRIERGEMYVPHWDEALASITRYVDSYNKRHQDNLGNSPAALWEQLERSPLHIDRAALIRPREPDVAVRSHRIQLFNRVYEAPALRAYEGRRVQVQYDLHDDRLVSLYDPQGRYITDAALYTRKPWISESREQDLRHNSARAAVQRLENKAQEARDRARMPITAGETLAGLDHLDAEPPAPVNEIEGLPPLDLLDTDY